MSVRRPQILAGILLAVLLVFWAGGFIDNLLGAMLEDTYTADSFEAPPLEGENALSAFTIQPGANGEWIADFDYFYTGAPKFASARIVLDPDTDPKSPEKLRDTLIPSLQRGSHHVHVALKHPGHKGRTEQALLRMQTWARKKPPIVTLAIDRRIDWPGYELWLQKQEDAAQSH